MHWRIEQIIDQMGGRGVRGALGYIGASEIAYHCRKDDSKPVNSTVDDHGLIEFEIGLMFRVNGKEREAWKRYGGLQQWASPSQSTWKRTTRAVSSSVMGIAGS